MARKEVDLINIDSNVNLPMALYRELQLWFKKKRLIEYMEKEKESCRLYDAGWPLVAAS